MKNLLTLFMLILINFSQLDAQNTADMLEKSMSAVVTVAVYETDLAKKSLGFRGSPIDIAYAKALDLTGVVGSGSGFVIERNGEKYIITNAHVIEQAADKAGSIFVYSISRKKYEAKIVGGDSFYDFAVLKFTEKPGDDITSISFRNDDIRVGEQVFAIGNPLGEYPYSVSEGIISAKNRVRGGLTGKFGFLQTTATVIWGNSGGPLIDNSGKVAGINSQIAFATQGNEVIWQPQINFALETKIALRLINDILQNDGLVSRAYLGIEVSQYQPAVNKYNEPFRLNREEDAKTQFPVITGVVKGSPAEKSLADKIGYSIISVNGNATRNAEEVLGEFENAKPGSAIKLILQKENKTQEVTVETAKLNANRATQIAQYIAKIYNWTLMQDNNQVNIKINKTSQQDSYGNNYSLSLGDNNRNPNTKNIPEAEWVLIGAGILEEDYENIWRIEELADIATAARLTALAGAIDLVLFKKGGDPQNQNNYIKHRVNLSESNKMYRKVLLY